MPPSKATKERADHFLDVHGDAVSLADAQKDRKMEPATPAPGAGPAVALHDLKAEDSFWGTDLHGCLFTKAVIKSQARWTRGYFRNRGFLRTNRRTDRFRRRGLIAALARNVLLDGNVLWLVC